MRNIILLLLLCSTNAVLAQRMIANKLNVQLTYSSINVSGDKTLSTGSYSSPSLVNNFKAFTSFGADVSYSLKPTMAAYISVSDSKLEDWENPEDDRFAGAVYSVLSIDPQLGINTKMKEKGIFNSVTLLVRGGPAFGFHTANLVSSPYDANNPVDFDFRNSSFFSFGVTGSAGVNMALHNNFYIGASYGLTHYWMSNVLFEDRKMTITSFRVHLGVRLMKNRRFKYAP